MKIKTSNLTGPALDWAVAKIEGADYFCANALTEDADLPWEPCFNYSTDWSQGGPIIQREGINTYQMQDGTWQGNLDYGMVDEAIYQGPTPLVAACRCYVASRLGDEVEVPNELLTKSDIIRALHPDATELKVTAADPADFTGFPTLKP